MENYWTTEIRSYENQWLNGPDAAHDHWKWREFLKLNRIMDAEIKCKVRLQDVEVI